MKQSKMVLITWKDAMSDYGTEEDTPAVPELATLYTVGFLLAENSEAVQVGLEVPGHHAPSSGRWKINIPRTNIVSIQELVVKKSRKQKEVGG